MEGDSGSSAAVDSGGVGTVSITQNLASRILHKWAPKKHFFLLFHCITMSQFPRLHSDCGSDAQLNGEPLRSFTNCLISLMKAYHRACFKANKCISIQNESLCHGDYIILFTSAYCLGMLCFSMCMEDRWTVSPAIISYLPERHLFIGQQIEL